MGEYRALFKDAQNYEAVIKHMLHNDEPCPGPMCRLTMMGHLLDGLDDDLLDCVKSLDEEFQRGEIR